MDPIGRSGGFDPPKPPCFFPFPVSVSIIVKINYSCKYKIYINNNNILGFSSALKDESFSEVFSFGDSSFCDSFWASVLVEVLSLSPGFRKYLHLMDYGNLEHTVKTSVSLYN